MCLYKTFESKYILFSKLKSLNKVTFNFIEKTLF